MKRFSKFPAVIAGFTGTEITPDFLAAIEAGWVQGVILFRDNFTGDWRSLMKNLSALAGRFGLIIAIDQEGGRVQRFTSAQGFTDFPSARDVAAGSVKAAYDLYRKMARELADVGVDLNFGPVVDLDIDPQCPIIGHYGRSYGADPNQVAAYAEAFVQAHRDEGLLTCLKHFPGHGSSRQDSHLGFTDITDTWSPVELEPYRILIGKNLADMVMVGHLFHHGIDPEAPATLSRAHLRVLRETLGFTGPTVTDDLVMGAIADHYTGDEANRLALDAGCDILIRRRLD
jgi:beta-N-acetylhexosaminidase